MNPSLATNIGLLISVGIVLATVAGELRARVIDKKTLWVRPALLGVLTVALGGLSLKLAPHLASVLMLYAAGGGIVGVLVGLLLARRTAITRAGNLDSLQVRGSAITIAIWLAFIAGRLALRSVTPGVPILGLDASVASTAAIASAFAVLAVSFRSAIHRSDQHDGSRHPKPVIV